MKHAHVHVVDRRLFPTVIAAFAIGVFIITWHRETLRLEFGGQSVAWPAVVAFGVMWLAGSDAFRRTAAGLVFGALAALAGVYGMMSLLPLNPIVVGASIAFVAAIAATITHVFPHVASFAATAIGYGVGLSVAGAAGFRPTTSAADWFTVSEILSLALVFGVLGAQALRTVVVMLNGVPSPVRTARIPIPAAPTNGEGNGRGRRASRPAIAPGAGAPPVRRTRSNLKAGAAKVRDVP
jgi:hypothetical protein